MPRAAAAAALVLHAVAGAQEFEAPARLDSGRFTIVYYPPDGVLARSLLEGALNTDTFPGLPRPREQVIIGIAPDKDTFRRWIGPHAPEWGAAVAFPGLGRIVLQGSGASSFAGDPRTVLRHELAHLALNEVMGNLSPRWFDEGYASFAAGEIAREATLAANLWLVLRGVPSLDSLDARFYSGSSMAQAAYALSHVAVAELAALDPERGLTLFLRYWKETGSMERAVRSAYGLTLSGFETRWKRRVRLRYGVIAIFADLSILGIGVLLIFLPVYVMRRRRYRERLAGLRAAEALAQARQEAEQPTGVLLFDPEPEDPKEGDRAPGQ